MITTTGDKILTSPLPEIGGKKGLFTKNWRRNYLHMMRIVQSIRSKTFPSIFHRDLPWAASHAEKTRGDVLVSPRGYTLDTLPEAGVVGTPSPRHAAQLLSRRPDLHITSLRGNIETRCIKPGKVIWTRLFWPAPACCGWDCKAILRNGWIWISCCPPQDRQLLALNAA